MRFLFKNYQWYVRLGDASLVSIYIYAYISEACACFLFILQWWFQISEYIRLYILVDERCTKSGRLICHSYVQLLAFEDFSHMLISFLLQPECFSNSILMEV